MSLILLAALIQPYFSSEAIAQHGSHREATAKKFRKMKPRDKVNYLTAHGVQIDNPVYLQKFEADRPELMKLFEKKGQHIASVWGDTIFEGPYRSDNPDIVELHSVYKIKESIVAMRGRVYTNGYFYESEDCVWIEESETYKNCPEVLIYEYFTMDLDGNVLPTDDYVETDE